MASLALCLLMVRHIYTYLSTSSLFINPYLFILTYQDYIKGDSAYLYVTPKESDEKLTVASKDVIKSYILKGIDDTITILYHYSLDDAVLYMKPLLPSNTNQQLPLSLILLPSTTFTSTTTKITTSNTINNNLL